MVSFWHQTQSQSYTDDVFFKKQKWLIELLPKFQIYLGFVQ